MKDIKEFMVPDCITKKELKKLNEINGIKVSQIENMTYLGLDYLGYTYIYEPGELKEGKPEEERKYYYRNSFPLRN